MKIEGTPETVYWAKKGFRDAVAKVAGVMSNQIFWYKVSFQTSDQDRSDHRFRSDQMF